MEGPGTVVSTHGNLYQHATCPSYRYCSKKGCSPLWSAREGGPRHDRREETGGSAVNVRASRRLRTSGKHENTLPFVGRVLGHVQLLVDA